MVRALTPFLLLLLSFGLVLAPSPVRADEAYPDRTQPPEVRERMAELLLLPREKLWKELSKWPAFKQMTLDEQSAFLARLASMKRQAEKKALDHAVRIGLAIPQEKHEAFTDDYLRERLHLHRKFVAEKRKGKTPSPEAFDKEFDRRLTKKYGPAPAELSGGTTPAPAAVAADSSTGAKSP